MESMIFGFCLWFVVFSLLCWLVAPVSAPASASKPESVTVTENKKQEETEDRYKEFLSRVDIDSLSLRELRQVIRALNDGLAKNDPQRIRQKVNKKDAPLDWLKAQVKTRLQEEPHQLERVLAAVKAA